jgi:hypothetical protein
MVPLTGSQPPEAYDPNILSEAEEQRFLAALGDGFGYSRSDQRKGQLEDLALPTEVEPGLLRHRAYYYRNRPSEYWGDREEDEFWEPSDGDSPPGLFEQCPIGFHLPAIRKYFEEQKAAYLAYAKSSRDYTWLDDLPDNERADREERIYRQVLRTTYSKAWYEYHINEHLFFLDEEIAILNRGAKQGNSLGLSARMIIKFSATLGRLIEQYYWKFFVETAAIRGAKISQSAQTGGLKLASRRKEEHAAWQAEANSIWGMYPEKSKMSVASAVRKRLKIERTAKHISRVLRRPTGDFGVMLPSIPK